MNPFSHYSAENILEVYEKRLSKITSLRELLTQDNKLNPDNLMEGEATHTKIPLDNGQV